MKKKNNSLTVLVTGDVTVDWNIARVRQTEGTRQNWNDRDWTAVFGQYGGAAMLTDIISAVTKDLKQKKQADINLQRISLDRGNPNPSDRRFPHSYAIWVLLITISVPGKRSGVCRNF